MMEGTLNNLANSSHKATTLVFGKAKDQKESAQCGDKNGSDKQWCVEHIY